MPEQKLLRIDERPLHVFPRPTAIRRDADVAEHRAFLGRRRQTRQRRQEQIGDDRRMFGALAERGINIAMINTSEIRGSVVVDRGRGQEALEALKKAFNLT